MSRNPDTLAAAPPTRAPAGTPRGSARIVRGMPTSDGAGVKLTRVIGQPQLPDLDPFLLLDEFGTDNPGDYIGGFPEHPHRGFETVTYMLDGRMRHRDNHGHEGVLAPGSVQWMTAGRGIVHSEMPEQQEGRMRGFQLWINLPAREKMTAPKYQEFAAERIPVATPGAGARIKVIAGAVGSVRGPIVQPASDPIYLDIELAPGARFAHALPHDHAAFLYVFEGRMRILGAEASTALAAHELAVLGAGGSIELEGAAEDPAAGASRAILVAGRPLREPVARYGPFVMNTRAELERAFADLQNGRF
ncbi:MAG TPA: pirin family protein [Steroidobacteraceae bacterium]|nr:pirin family protein [Steroidobacteraceae bacterium]